MSFRTALRAFERTRLRPLLRRLRGKSGEAIPSPEELQRILALSLEQARAADGAALPRLGLVTVLPPATTGIAAFGLSAFPSLHWRLDTYAPFSRASDLEALIQASASATRGFLDLGALGQAVSLADYQALILQIGNSGHHLPCLKSFEGLDHPRRWAYLHEAQLVRFWTAWAEGDPGRLLKLYREAYPERRFSLADLMGGQEAPSRAPLGLRLLLRQAGIRRFLVNNQVTEDRLIEDLGPSGPVEIHRLFHPVPRLPQPAAREGGDLRIGHFGSIGSGKGVPLLLEAMRQLRKRRPATLVLAGFDAGRWARKHRVREPWIEILDHPSDQDLLGAMASVDVAVQLRLHTQGESSGVVCQLLGLGRRIIATDIGAFREYGPALALVPPSVDAATLADRIAQVAGQDLSAEILRAQAAFAPEAFHRALASAVGLELQSAVGKDQTAAPSGG